MHFYSGQCLFYGLDDDLQTGLVFTDETILRIGRYFTDLLDSGARFDLDHTTVERVMLSYFTDGLDQAWTVMYFADRMTFLVIEDVASYSYIAIANHLIYTVQKSYYSDYNTLHAWSNSRLFIIKYLDYYKTE